MSAIIKKLTSFLPHKGIKVGKHPMFFPDRDWQIMLIATIVVNLVIGGIASYMFFQIQSGNFFKQIQATPRSESVALETHTLNDIVEYFEQKRSLHKTFISEPPQTIDPYK